MKIGEKEGEDTHIYMLRKLEETLRKMEKIETSILKRHQRINSQLFASLDFVTFILGHVGKRERELQQDKESKQVKESKESKGKAKESEGKQGEGQINDFNNKILHVTGCVYVYLAYI